MAKLTPCESEALEALGAKAEALRVAERWLVKHGWRFTPADVGKRAREVLDAMAPEVNNG